MYYLVGSVPFCYPKVELQRSKIPSFFNKLEKIGFAQKNIICTALLLLKGYFDHEIINKS